MNEPERQAYKDFLQKRIDTAKKSVEQFKNDNTIFEGMLIGYQVALEVFEYFQNTSDEQL